MSGEAARRWAAGRASAAGTALLVAIAGCDETASAPVVTRTDSAGILIVSSSDTDRAPIVLSANPIVTLGGHDVAGPTQFSYLSGVEFDRLGRLWVAESLTMELRVFAEDGSHLTTLGGKGDGPGEYRVLTLVGSTRSGEVVATDTRSGRVDWYSPAMEPVRSVSLPRGGQDGAISIVGDSSLLGILDLRPTFRSAENERLDHDVRLVRWHLSDLREVPVTTVAWGSRILIDRVSMPFPLTTAPGIGGRSGPLIAGPSEWTVRMFGEHGLTRILRVHRDPPPVSGKMLFELRRIASETRSGSALERRMRLLARDDLPGTAPTYDRVVEGLDGRIWARRWQVHHHEGSRWDLFGEAGHYLGPVSTPPDFEIKAATSDRVAGVSKDVLDVPFVRVYRLEPQ